MLVTLLLIGLGTLSILLGFIALLSQKIYLHPETKELTEVEVPILGRLRTNYPALVFVLLGFSLIFYVVGTMPPKPVKWLVEGRFIANNPKMIWHLDKLSIHPCDFTPSMDNGKFTISLELGEGVTFEDKVEKISYADSGGSFTIWPKKELKLDEKGNDASLLKARTATTRVYKDVHLTTF